MRPKKLKKLHVSDLYDLIINGNQFALTEMINRQQRGRALRYYPEGRKDIHDDGIIPVLLEHSVGNVVIRTGRPNRDVSIGKEATFSWLLKMPSMIAECAAWREDYNGTLPENAWPAIDYDAQKDFSFAVGCDDDPDTGITLSLRPRGEMYWRPPVIECARIVKALAECCKRKGWTYDKVATTDAQKMLLDLISKTD
ncbi:hypothetical protein OAF30_03555 [Flavobacteriales bacterium]|nr:hypothetical protein [Flavobacteriales bacterium]